MNVDPALVAVVDRWDDPRYGLRMTRDDLMRAAREGVDAVSAEAGIRRMIPAYHEGLVVLLANRKLNRGLEFDDLKQEGNLGLIRAAEKFRPGHMIGGEPARFSTYADRWVRNFMEVAIWRDGSIIRMPFYLDALLKQIESGEVRVESLGFQLRQTAAFAIAAAGVAAARDEVDLRGWADMLPDTRATQDRSEDFAALRRMVAGLCDSERAAITLRYGLDGRGERAIAEIDEELGIGREAAAKRVKRAMENLRLAATRRGMGFAELMSA